MAETTSDEQVFAIRFNHLFRLAGVTQTRLSEYTGIPQTIFSRLMGRRARCTVHQAILLSRGLGIPVSLLIDPTVSLPETREEYLSLVGSRVVLVPSSVQPGIVAVRDGSSSLQRDLAEARQGQASSGA